MIILKSKNKGHPTVAPWQIEAAPCGAVLGLPYRPENSVHVRYLGLNFASGRN